jgi:alpha-galactosidase
MQPEETRLTVNQSLSRTCPALRAGTAYSGEYLMTVGFNPVVNANRVSVVLEIAEAR